MPNLDFDSGIVQQTKPIEKTFKFLFQREIGVTTLRLPLRLRIQLDGLNDARFWFIAGQPAANQEPLDYTKTQCFDDLHSPALTGIET
jgi:hypothetical protein